MFNKLESGLTSRLTSTMLTAFLVAVLTAPFVMLQSMHAFAAPAPLPCTLGNYNGCIELSATPPQDIAAVPPNIVLMFDDSGSMAWDFMPDWDALGAGVTGWNSNNDGVRNPAINMVYYNPATIYTPPPYADSVDSSHLYPDSPGLLKAYNDGFLDLSKKDITAYTGGSVDVNTFPYYTTLAGAPIDYGPATATTVTTTACPSGWNNTVNPAVCVRAPSNPTSSTTWKCNAGDFGPTTYSGVANMCRNGSGESATWYKATSNTSTPACPSGSTGPVAGKCNWPNKDPVTSTTTTYKCPSGGSPNGAHECMANQSVRAFTYVLGTPGKYVEHYVASGSGCTIISNTTQRGNCVSDGDTSGVAAPNTVPVKNADGTVTMTTALAQDGSKLTAGQNVANWFSYYRTRMLMSKTGLMTGMSALDKSYRVGFASINGYATGSIPAGASSATAPYTFDDSMADGSGGKAANKLAVVQPFGDGSTGSQKANFWAWLVAEQPDGQTPLRKALNSAGQYYQTNQPWSAMTGDPGYTGTPKTYACRASYTILTTDGFWNGDDPGVPDITNATEKDGLTHPVATGVTMTHYSAVPPFSGGFVHGVTSLADVATYYWENDLSSMVNEVSAGGDAATWQHMTTYTIGLGFPPVNISPSTVAVTDIFGWAHALDGGKSPNPDPADTTFAWPNPASNDVNNIADLVHTAVNGRGNYFNVTSKDDITSAFAAIGNILGGHQGKASAAVNASVLAVGAVTFRVGYDTSNWSGSFEAIALKNDGTLDLTLPALWDAGTKLDAKYHTTGGYSTRVVYTVSNKGGTLTPLQFNVTNLASLDGAELAGLGAPALGGGTDTLDNRINYLLGDPTNEGTKAPSYRVRSTILGSILRSDPVYVAGATGNYRDSWPTFGTPTSPVKPPEGDPLAQSFAAFVSAEATRTPMVYVGANDGMLHAFNAPVPTCTGGVDSDGNCKAYTPGTTDGQEAWAFVPRAVYANLGNLTNTTDFSFRPTVDATPVSRDVYFSSDKKWHTLLTGGVGLGGRGVYGLDITDPSTAFSASNVLWEFDSDMVIPAATCATNDGTACNGNDLGYTVAQPNVARLANGEWVVLVPNGYFPDCTTTDFPTYPDKSACNAISAQAPKTTAGVPYSALFVLDAATGKVIAELKTPSAANGVTSFGLSKPVLGDYNNDQVDDVAFAGDAQGNLWRFDLSNATDPTKWTVTLAYKGNFNQPASPNHQGTQPITTMPRLFPDPTTNRFMVLFGTGKYLGMGDNSNTDVQAIIAVRDGGVTGTAYSQTDLVPQYMHEGVVAAGLPNAGATLRCVTGSATDTCTSADPSAINPITSGKGGWYVDLETKTGGVLTDAGERVVVNPGAIFASNTVVFETLITGSATTDACNPATVGALLAFNAITGGSGGVSSLGGQEIIGGRITNARTSGSLPTVSTLGGGKVYLPGATLSPGNTPISVDAPIWRRRSWRVLMNDQ